MAAPTIAGRPAITRAGAWDKGASDEMLQVTGNGVFTVLSGSADVMPLVGNVELASNGVDATTLATPTSGVDDGKTIWVVDTGGYAHTITTASNKISPSHSVATFNGTVGSNVTLRAYKGLIYPVGTPLGVSFS